MKNHKSEPLVRNDCDLLFFVFLFLKNMITQVLFIKGMLNIEYIYLTKNSIENF